MKNRVLPIVILTLAVALGVTHPLAAEASDDVKPSDDAKPSVTVFPVVAKPNRFPDELAKRVGIVIATFLEKAGLEELEVADTMFDPPETDEIDSIAEAFGKHVGEKPIKTDYAVFAQILGTPKTGVSAIHTIVVDKSGKVLFAESAGKAQFDKAQLRPKDPMSCCVFVSRRLQDLWQLEDPLRPNAPEGKMARFWQQDAGIPAKDELDAIAKRSETLKKNIKTATCTVYPVNVGRQSDKQCAVDLVAMLNEGGLCKAETSEADPALKVANHSNEQKVLWDTARAFRDFVKKNQPTTDYAVYVDYGLSGTNVHHVHAIICDRSGDWVLIDMQNSHHPTFERIDPKSAADCNRLLLARLQAWLSEST
jgi:hypothetical protein